MLQEPETSRPLDDLEAGVDVQFSENVFQVIADGAFGQEELGGHLVGGEAGGQQGYDFELAWGEGFDGGGRWFSAQGCAAGGEEGFDVGGHQATGARFPE